MLVLCQHNTLAYYAFYYAGKFDTGLGKPVELCTISKNCVAIISYWNKKL